MRYGELTSPELSAIDKGTIVVLPLGACEQHGPHMPMLTDTLLVTAVAEAAERRMTDDVLLLPTQWMGMSDHHLSFAGTVSANPELYSRWVLRTVETVIGHGFRKLLVLNGHGGNGVPMKQALAELHSRGADRPDLWVVGANYWELGPTVSKAASEGINGIRMQSSMMIHADEWEYSLALHVFPELCRPDRVRAVPTDFKTDYYDVDEGKFAVALSTPFTAFIPTGAANRPELATAEKGQALFDAFVDDVLAFLDEFKTWTRHRSSDEMGRHDR